MTHEQAISILNWYGRTRETVWKRSVNGHIFFATMSLNPMEPEFEWFGSNVFEAAGHIIAICYATGEPADASEIPSVLDGTIDEFGRVALEGLS